MKSFREYLAESRKDSYFAIKLAMKPTDEQVTVIEKYLEKYGLQKFDEPVHVEHDKQDFYNTVPHDIWQIVAVLSQPISQYILMQELKAALDIPEDYIVVRSANEPVEIYAQDCEFDCEVDADAKDKELVPASRLSTSRFYDDTEQPLLTNLFGNDYNKKFLDFLAHVAEERPTDHYEAPAPLFSWIDMSKIMKDQEVEADDFNKHIDTPKPVYKGKGKATAPVDVKDLGPADSLEDSAIQRIKLLKDKDGKREAVSAPRARLKAGK